MRKVKGFKFTYYFKNGTSVVDDAMVVDTPIEENNSDFVQTVEGIRDLIKDAVENSNNGYIVLGTLYVNSAEVIAINFEIVYED